MSTANLNALLNSQRDVFGRISRSVDNLRKLGSSNITRSAAETRIRILDQLWTKCETQHDLIMAAYKDKYDESEYAKTNFFDTTENTYVQQRSVSNTSKDSKSRRAIPPSQVKRTFRQKLHFLASNFHNFRAHSRTGPRFAIYSCRSSEKIQQYLTLSGFITFVRACKGPLKI